MTNPALSRVLAGALLLAVVVTAGARPAESQVTNSATDSSKVQILELEKEFTAALLARDEKAVGNLLDDDLIHIGFEGQIVGKTEYMTFFKMGDWRYSKYAPEGMVVKILEEGAVATGRVQRVIVVNGKETTGSFAFTHVWRKANGAWRLTSSHVTSIPPKGPTR